MTSEEARKDGMNGRNWSNKKQKCIAQHGDSIDVDVQEKTASYKEYVSTHFSCLLVFFPSIKAQIPRDHLHPIACVHTAVGPFIPGKSGEYV
ncbi:hypothetical protein E1A91_D05G326900v1 [Gossypium mustelinum]|uniref:Uncharacterized protein n=1 Tax=Gossypium mustelinum TaxID=34275 RepID=A0A5D2V3T0_GOSMU|nr:hypothetical protein E1A91_D05G326900v1 [Gossypium mustelinum]